MVFDHILMSMYTFEQRAVRVTCRTEIRTERGFRGVALYVAGGPYKFSEIFIRRPIATSLLMAGIAMFGVLAYRSMPVSDLPTVDYPTINVSASRRRRSKHDVLIGCVGAGTAVHWNCWPGFDDIAQFHRTRNRRP